MTRLLLYSLIYLAWQATLDLSVYFPEFKVLLAVMLGLVFWSMGLAVREGVL